jgi:membrane-associated phospholipid phosphatase
MKYVVSLVAAAALTLLIIMWTGAHGPGVLLIGFMTGAGCGAWMDILWPTDDY